jgi:ribosomal protein L14E/L6E/L27E
MDLKVGTVVISKAGRDKGHPLAVVGTDGKFIFVADGKERPLSRPKKKNPIHVAKTNRTVAVGDISDKALRRALKEAFAKGGSDETIA